MLPCPGHPRRLSLDISFLSCVSILHSHLHPAHFSLAFSLLCPRSVADPPGPELVSRSHSPLCFPMDLIGPVPGRVWPSSLLSACPRAVIAGAGSVAGVPCRVAGGPPRVVWLAPNPAPCLRARPGTESAPWPHALPRAAVRLCPLEACGVFPPLNAGGCCLVWLAVACRAGFVLYFRPHSLCHLGLCQWFCPPLPCHLSARCMTRSARVAEHCSCRCGVGHASTAVCIWLCKPPVMNSQWRHPPPACPAAAYAAAVGAAAVTGQVRRSRV